MYVTVRLADALVTTVGATKDVTLSVRYFASLSVNLNAVTCTTKAGYPSLTVLLAVVVSLHGKNVSKYAPQPTAKQNFNLVTTLPYVPRLCQRAF